MGIIKAIWDSRNFKSHDHIKISGAGVLSVDSEHYINSKKAKESAEKIAKLEIKETAK